MRTLADARRLPWSLGAGDREANLVVLQAGPKPEEPVAAKIWHLLRLGYNRLQLNLGIDLLMDCPWGTASVERQHASATLLRKYHPEYGQETFMV
eukprot:7843964-Lingulodinium_polyedra.AAC.1